MISRADTWAEAERHRPDIERYARGCRLSREDAEDLASVVMLRVVEEAKEVGAIGYLMFRAMTWAVTDFTRQRSSRHERMKGLARVIRSGAGTSWDAMMLAAGAESTSESSKKVLGYDTAEFVNIEAIELRDYVSTLNREHAEVIWLDYWRFSAAEGAELLGITVPAYKAKLYRARKELKSILAAEMPIKGP